jgi:hypothetical protein
VDREVHATAGQEAGATCSFSDRQPGLVKIRVAGDAQILRRRDGKARGWRREQEMREMFA